MNILLNNQLYRFIIILTGIIPVSIYAQTFSRVVDKETLETISYVHFSNGGKLVSISDENGLFKIPNDSSIIAIQRLGYNSINLTTKLLKDTLYLQPKITILQEVVVTPKNHKMILTYFFREYLFKNNILKRYIDGIAEYDISNKDKTVRKLIEYRNFINDSIIASEKRRFIQITYEGIGTPFLPKSSIYDRAKKYWNIEESDKNNLRLTITEKNKDYEINGIVFLNADSVEQYAYLIDGNLNSKNRKILGVSGRNIFISTEEKYFYSGLERYFLNRRMRKKSTFKRKKEKLYSEFETYSELIFLEVKNEFSTTPKKNLKYSSLKSYFCTEYWEDYAKKVTNQSTFDLDKLSLVENHFKSP